MFYIVYLSNSGFTKAGLVRPRLVTLQIYSVLPGIKHFSWINLRQLTKPVLLESIVFGKCVASVLFHIRVLIKTTILLSFMKYYILLSYCCGLMNIIIIVIAEFLLPVTFYWTTQ